MAAAPCRGFGQCFDYSYRLLLDAMDTHDLARGRGAYEEVVRQIQQPVLVVGRVPMRCTFPVIRRSCIWPPNSRILQIDSAHGHDGFLIDAESFDLRFAVS